MTASIRPGAAGAIFRAPNRRILANRRILDWLANRRRMASLRGAFQGLAQAFAEFEEAERGRFVLWLPVFMGAGVLAYFTLRAEPPAWIGASIAVLGFGVALALPNRALVRALGFLCGFAGLGFASAQYTTARAPPIEANLPTHAVMMTGTVRAVEIMPNGRRITLAGADLTDAPFSARGKAANRAAPVDAEPAPVRHLVRTARIRLFLGDDVTVATGDRVRVRAMAFPPSPPAMPGGWDTQRDAFFSGLGVSGYALGRVEITERASPDRFLAYVQRLREIIAGRITAVVPGSSGAVAVTLLTGAARGIPEADHSAFRDSGLAHLLAVAGLHIGIVMGFALGAARMSLALSERASLFWPTKKIAAVIALCVGGGYMVLTGAHVPIVRSFAMACLFTLAVVAGRQPVSVRGLGLAGIALMLIAPYEVPGVSFQMSFSAVLALISGYETLRPWLRRLYGKTLPRRMLSYLAALALTSTLAGTASLPYSAYHFGHVQIYYVLSNLIAVPVTALWVMPAGMIALVLMPLGLEWLALVPMGWGVTVIIQIARITAALPSATVAVPHMPEWGLAVLSMGIAWLGIWRSQVRLAGLALIAAGVLSPMLDRPPDILISADAGLIGFRTDEGVFLQRTRGNPSFVRDAWFGRWNVATSAPLPVEGRTGSGALTCVTDACVFHPLQGHRTALLVRGAARPAGCAEAGVIVSAEPARSVCPWPAARTVDRFTVWREGAVAIWLDPDGVRVLSDRVARGDRPWVPPPPKPRPRPVPNLPLAPLDTGDR
jgi:competence protein ComEC